MIWTSCITWVCHDFKSRWSEHTTIPECFATLRVGDPLRVGHLSSITWVCRDCGEAGSRWSEHPAQVPKDPASPQAPRHCRSDCSQELETQQGSHHHIGTRWGGRKSKQVPSPYNTTYVHTHTHTDNTTCMQDQHLPIHIHHHNILHHLAPPPQPPTSHHTHTPPPLPQHAPKTTDTHTNISFPHPYTSSSFPHPTSMLKPKKTHAHARQLTPVLLSSAAVVLVSLEDARVEGVDTTGVVLACLADGRDPALQLIHILKNIQWYPSLETTLISNHYEETSPWGETTFMRNHHERQPPGDATLKRNHHEKRPSWWETTIRRDHPEERPPWGKTAMWRDHLKINSHEEKLTCADHLRRNGHVERPPWGETDMWREHLRWSRQVERPPEEKLPYGETTPRTNQQCAKTTLRRKCY